MNFALFPDPPTKRDAAKEDAHIRLRVCEDITDSDIFMADTMEAVDMDEMYKELNQEKYSDLFHQIYEPTKNPAKSLIQPYEYKNLYTLREMDVLIRFVDSSSTTFRFPEYVFVCLLRNWDSNDISAYYVSKEYNVSDDGPYTAGHFVFWGRGRVILSEEPAKSYARNDYNVELHYLHLRKYHQPGTSNYSSLPLSVWLCEIFGTPGMNRLPLE